MNWGQTGMKIVPSSLDKCGTNHVELIGIGDKAKLQPSFVALFPVIQLIHQGKTPSAILSLNSHQDGI